MSAITGRALSAPFTLETVVLASKDAISCDLKGEAIVLNIASGVYFGLEGAGVDIWDQIRTPSKVSDVAASLISKYDVDPDLCRSRTLAFMRELAEYDLLLVADGCVP